MSDVIAYAGQDICVSYGGSVSRVYGAALDCFVLGRLSDVQAQKLVLDLRIEFVEADRTRERGRVWNLELLPVISCE